MKDNASFIQRAEEILRQKKGDNLEETAVELAALLQLEAARTTTHKEKKQQEELARMMRDPKGKAFTLMMTDECFRSHRSPRVANQMIYLLEHFGIPEYLSTGKALKLAFFKEMASPLLSYLLVPLAKDSLRKATEAVILPGEKMALKHHMKVRKQQGVRLNINHLGEAILGEKESKDRLKVYLDDLKGSEIDYVSVKISTIYSQINLLGWEHSLEMLAERLKELYRAAMPSKFVNLDMEEYRDLELTKDLFMKVLNEPEFHNYSAGIVLQAYLPDSYAIQQELTTWAKGRVKKGGAPIKIRIVKGANMAMERVEASIQGWPQAPYKTKKETDANYKRMVVFGSKKENAEAVHLGVASHNLFDIAFALLKRAENEAEKEIIFEMLEGMAEPMRRSVQAVAHDMLLYCPVAKKSDFQSAVGYLIRRLDENTGPENFLRHSFNLKPDTAEWESQAERFRQACKEIDTVSAQPRRTQNRMMAPKQLPIDAPFENEPDTDFSLKANRQWAVELTEKWKSMTIPPIPLVIGGKEVHSDQKGEGLDPSFPDKVSYNYSLASWEQIDEALQAAKNAEDSWGHTTVEARCILLANAAQKMRERRNDLIGVMMADAGKTIWEGDPEVSEAIDFADYYLRSRQKMEACTDIKWQPKGTVLVTPPWNFPVSIPAGGILAALMAGNCVLFKPAPETVHTGWVLVNALWDAGIPKNVLQFINCEDDPVGSKLIQDERINVITLTGATSTARLFLNLRPGLELHAETGGKNAMIITGLADRDLAIKDLIYSAFGHSGQKCSATSLAILEAEVYDDPIFMKQLKDAVESLTVDSPWNLSAKVTPLIREASEVLKKGLTTLERGEKWLVEPKQNSSNPNLWSPGVKLGVKQGSFMHQTELFGPVLAVMRAENLDEAIEFANGTPYGLTSGLHSLDEREQKKWLETIEAGNCYINRRTTGAVVRRQPFGGTKASSFGGGAKAGGPNYVAQFCNPKQMSLAHEKAPLVESVNNLSNYLAKFDFSPEQQGLWYASISNYSFWSRRFEVDHDPSKLVGQDNLFRYRPHKKIGMRIHQGDDPLDILRSIAAALVANARLEISWTKNDTPINFTDHWKNLSSKVHFIEESEETFLKRVKKGSLKRLRLLSHPSKALEQAAAESGTYIAFAPVLSNGRFELLHYLREISISFDYHRYGNLGVREGELRSPVL